MLREDLPQGFAVHETSTYSTSFPSLPCFNNLVFFDPAKPTESMDTIVGDLAERWSWQDNYKNLVFFLRKDVKWHDGKPFTSKDVKFTFDMLREAPDAPAKLRINPRKDWYANIEHVEAADPYTVVFRMKRPQPSLLMMLASGYTPIYAAHIPPAQYRTSCIGTGPFKLKEWRKGEFVEYVKNPDYFVKGRPYLDGLKYVVIVERGTRTAALQAGQLDTACPGETSKTTMDQLKKAVPQMVFHTVAQDVTDNIIMNVKKPPFDNPKVRLAVSYAIDRRGLIQASHQGGAVLGAAMLPRPYGVWGMSDKDLLALPGYGKADEMKARAQEAPRRGGDHAGQAAQGRDGDARHRHLRRHGLLRHQRAEAGGDRGHAQAGGDGPVASHGHARRLPDRRQPHRARHRRSRRELLRELRLRVSAQLQPVLQRGSHEDVRPPVPGARSEEAAGAGDRHPEAARAGRARPILAQRLDYFAHWPHVKGLVPHNNVYNFSRFQDVWRDK